VTGTWNSIGYDGLNRLTAASATAGYFAGLQTGWSYDSFGNRTDESFGGSPSVAMPTGSSASYNANNQVSASSLMLGAGLAYDQAGDVTEDNSNAYLYNADGQVLERRRPSLRHPQPRQRGHDRVHLRRVGCEILRTLRGGISTTKIGAESVFFGDRSSAMRTHGAVETVIGVLDFSVKADERKLGHDNFLL
jgi:hypothetical protein